ncbi:MAG TPA: glycosyltransferase [Polyangiaceae bacterium]|nr:glycosyltransferase [Polyangiaceae bacterium]
MPTSRELVVLLSLPSIERGSTVRLTKKLVSGLERYLEYWDGPVRAVMPPADDQRTSGNLDEVFLERASLPFSVDVVPLGSPRMDDTIREAGLVLGGADYRLTGVAARCRTRRVPYVFNSEYSLRTRWQVARADRKNPLKLARSMWWEWRLEERFRREVRDSAGVQCNGTPTFDAYASLSRSPLLYFDTRTDDAMLSTNEQLERKLAHRRQLGGPLRLAFSGRLNAMKGADDLPLVARELARRGVDFTLDICGDGPSRPAMEAAVQRHSLQSRVRFRGVLDFASELVPRVRDEVDLFVCCHKQGDPSCTYLETFACGVPIAGYDNEAFAGLMQRVPAGISTPLGDPVALASAIAGWALPNEQERLDGASRAALEFARQHTFSSTFRRRIAHLRELAES